MAEGDWWYDLNTRQAVQDDDKVGKAADRLGPYASREDAERALETIQARNEAADQWDEE